MLHEPSKEDVLKAKQLHLKKNFFKTSLYFMVLILGILFLFKLGIEIDVAYEKYKYNRIKIERAEL